MQFDKTRIVIRERALLDLLDLALHMVRVHWLPLLVASLVGVAPFVLLNYWLLADLTFVEEQDYAWYAFRMVLLVLFEAPLAAVPVTLLLGQAMFSERFAVARIVRQAIASLPQLFIYQFLIRGLLMPQALFWELFERDFTPFMWAYFIAWFVPFTYWPYIDEVILLERNPLRTGKSGRSTWKRSRVLHQGYYGDLFARLMGCAAIAAALATALWLASWYARGLFTQTNDFDSTMYTIYLPVALWIVAAFFNVVRFLSYLDLRIRREGWEVELMLRAEADRLARQYQYAG
ncbi:MAG: hypothetical protein WD894_03355 [Pirellulales bacterium]